MEIEGRFGKDRWLTKFSRVVPKAIGLLFAQQTSNWYLRIENLKANGRQRQCHSPMPNLDLNWYRFALDRPERRGNMMSDKKDDRPRNSIDVDPVTLFAITIAVLFIPLILSGFWN